MQQDTRGAHGEGVTRLESIDWCTDSWRDGRMQRDVQEIASQCFIGGGGGYRKRMKEETRKSASVSKLISTSGGLL